MKLLEYSSVLFCLLFAGAASAQQITVDEEDSVLDAEDQEQVFGNNNRAFAWQSLAINTFNRSRPGGNWVGTNFYLVGGELSSAQWQMDRAETVEIYDALTNSWSQSADTMPFAVSNIMGSTANIADNIYVFCGWASGGVRTDAVQIYNITTDTWSTAAAAYPSGPQYGVFAEPISATEIFCCGGTPATGTAVSDAYIYDTVTDTYTAIASMPTARYHLTGARSGNTIYVPAGFGTGTAFESFDLGTGTWTTLPPIPNDRAGCGVVASGPYCYIYMGDWSGFLADGVLWNQSLLGGAGDWDPLGAALGSAPTGKRTIAYGLVSAFGMQGAAAMNGWAGAFLNDNSALVGP